MDSNETARKIALFGALVAGITYFGVTILRDVFKTNSLPKKVKKKRRNSDSNDRRVEKINCFQTIREASSQTDLTLPIGIRDRSGLRNIPPELWSPWNKTIQERIRELNIRMVNTTHFSFKNNNRLPFNSSISLQNTPKHSSGFQSPEYPLSQSSSRDIYSMSRSAENLSQTKTPVRNRLSSSRSAIGVKRTIHLSIPSETEILMHKRILDKLFGKSNPNISQQESQSLTILLMSRDEDLLIKTLSVIANCAAFTVNIDTICDSGCVLMLYELLDHSNRAVQIAATNAVANIAGGERAQELLKECIPILITRMKTCDNDLQLNWTLIALANLALKDFNQLEMINGINRVMNLLSHTNPVVRLQAIKLLVNFSSNSEIVPYLLAAKAPNNLIALLDSNYDIEILLRLTNFLANVIEITCLKEIKAQDLPHEYKASSPETLYSAIFGFETSEILLEKLNKLNSIQHEDVVFQVKRILKKVR